MNDTINIINNEVMSNKCEHNRTKKSGRPLSSSVCVAPLTSYKIVVDNSKKILHYGLTKKDYELQAKKIIKQKKFLRNSYIYDRLSNKRIYLKEFVMSATHNPNRYYAEIQNRINTLTHEAQEKKLEPIFMTLTLPSEFHKMKYSKKSKKLIPNKKYNGTPPKEAVKELTKMFSKLRHDRSLKELSKNNRIYFRVNEPHKDGTPHTHILLYVPASSVNRVVKAFKRLFDNKANDIQTNINNATSYVMKYINKTLPLSKKDDLTQKEQYLNMWYSKNRIIRFNSSRTLAPLKIYRLLHRRFTLKTLTKLLKEDKLNIYLDINDSSKIMEILDDGEILYTKNYNIEVKLKGR